MLYLWIGFISAVLVLISLDLFVFHRKDEVMSVRSALKWSAFWVALAMFFSGAVYYMYEHHWYGLGQFKSIQHPNGLNGVEAAVVFLTGYVLELSLSVDNLFVIAVIFTYFAVPPKYQHRVLFWGIIGVLVMRGAMIGIGAALVARFQWILYLFGVILLYTAYKMLFAGGETDPKDNPVLRFARRFFPVTHEFHGHHFVVRESELHEGEEMEEEGKVVQYHCEDVTAPPCEDGATPEATALPAAAAAPATATAPPAAASHGGRNRWVLTPLALALIVVETTDLIFAVDSIPAIFGITDDPFLVFTSNVCAVLGLRSLFFALAGILEKFEYLKISLAAILALVGVKMLAHNWLHDIKHMNFYMLGVVGLLLAAGVVASLMLPPKKKEEKHAAEPHGAHSAEKPVT